MASQLSHPKLAHDIVQFLQGMAKRGGGYSSLGGFRWWLPRIIEEDSNFETIFEDLISNSPSKPDYISFELNGATIFIASLYITFDMRSPRVWQGRARNVSRGEIIKLIIEMDDGSGNLEMQWFVPPDNYMSGGDYSYDNAGFFNTYSMRLQGDEKRFSGWLTQTKLMA